MGNTSSNEFHLHDQLPAHFGAATTPIATFVSNGSSQPNSVDDEDVAITGQSWRDIGITESIPRWYPRTVDRNWVDFRSSYFDLYVHSLAHITSDHL